MKAGRPQKECDGLEIMFSGSVPMCSNKSQYNEWRQAARAGLFNASQLSFCTDCTPFYQKSMNDIGKCENNFVCFRYDEDGFIEGYVPSKDPAIYSVPKLIRPAKKDEIV